MRHLHYILAAVIFCTAGCAGTACYKPRHAIPDEGLIEIAGVPAFQQEKNQCGPAALASMLSWSGIMVKPDDLLEHVYDPAKEGSLQISLVAAARRYGRVAYEVYGMVELSEELSAGYPVLVLMNKGLSWWPVHHYAVVCGFDSTGRRLLLAGGNACKEYLSVRSFKHMWSRDDNWGLLVLPPGKLPETVTKNRWLEAVYGLERAGLHEAAFTGYCTALEKWPEDQGALMGKANTLYALGELEHAAKVLVEAAEIYPESGPVFNNLANVMLELGNTDMALKAALKAVDTGGMHLPVYRKTLERVHGTMESGKNKRIDDEKHGR